MELFWQKFIEGYAVNPGYWYVNKRLAVNEKNLELFRGQLAELLAFEGLPWNSENQKKYYDRLISERLIVKRAQAQTDLDATASVRMVKAVLDSLGLAWTQGIVQATKVGRKLLNENNIQKQGEIVQAQIRRYQFWNPSVNGEQYKEFRLVPYHFLLALLLNNEVETIGIADEFPLFVIRARSKEGYDETVGLIRKWRALDAGSQRTIIDALGQRYRGNKVVKGKTVKTQPIWRTIQQATAYIASFYSLPSELIITKGRLGLVPGGKGRAEEVLGAFNTCCDYIRFKSEADWFAYYGDSETTPTIQYATDYYLDNGDLESAKRLGYVSPEQLSETLLEEHVEDVLEADLSRLEYGLELLPGGRQYQTSVGEIDLLARDPEGKFVVIELKRGRTSDKVVGQISRYIGWVKEYIAHGKDVRGIIVGKSFDKNFNFAASNLRARTDFYTFDEDFNFKKQIE